jgi:hypothetical protein
VLPGFLGKLYLSQISVVRVDGLIHQTNGKKKRGGEKTVLFKFKILMGVDFKIQVTK